MWSLVVAAAMLPACSTTRSTASAHDAVDAIARFELDCNRVELVKLGGEMAILGTYDQTLGARGCGKRSVYLVSCINDLCSVRVE